MERQEGTTGAALSEMDYMKDIEEVTYGPYSSEDEEDEEEEDYDDDDEPKLRIDTSEDEGREGMRQESEITVTKAANANPLQSLQKLVHSPFLNTKISGSAQGCNFSPLSDDESIRVGNAAAEALKYASVKASVAETIRRSAINFEPQMSTQTHSRPVIIKTNLSNRMQQQHPNPILMVKRPSIGNSNVLPKPPLTSSQQSNKSFTDKSSSRLNYILNTLRRSATEERHLRQLQQLQQEASEEAEKFRKFQQMLKSGQYQPPSSIRDHMAMNAKNAQATMYPPMPARNGNTNSSRMMPTFQPLFSFPTNPKFPMDEVTITGAGLGGPSMFSKLDARAPPELTVIPRNVTTSNAAQKKSNCRRSPPPMVPITSIANFRPTNDDDVVSRLKKLGTVIEVEKSAHAEVEVVPRPPSGACVAENEEPLIPVSVERLLSQYSVTNNDKPSLPCLRPIPSSSGDAQWTSRGSSDGATSSRAHVPPPPPSLIPISHGVKPSMGSRFVPILPNMGPAPLRFQNRPIVITNNRMRRNNPPIMRKRKRNRLGTKSEYTRLAHALVQAATNDGRRNESFENDLTRFIRPPYHNVDVNAFLSTQLHCDNHEERLPLEVEIIIDEGKPNMFGEEDPKPEAENNKAPETLAKETVEEELAPPVVAEPSAVSPVKPKVIAPFVFQSNQAVPVGELPNGKKMYSCDICSGVYHKVYSLKKHYLRSHINPKFISEKDVSKFNILPEAEVPCGAGANVAEEGEDLLYRCNTCRRMFNERTELSSHLTDHPPVGIDGRKICMKRYTCSVCTLVFRRKKLYLRHVQNCSKRTPKLVRNAEDVEDGTVEEESMSSTVSKETEEDSLSTELVNDPVKETESTSKKGEMMCLFCERVFTDPTQRKKHVLQHHHPKRKQQPCSYCKNKKFNDLSVLLKHICEAHSKRYFGCASCKIRFRTKADLTSHNEESHQEAEESDERIKQQYVNFNKHGRAFRCTECPKVFSNTVEMGRHRKNAHREPTRNNIRRVVSALGGENFEKLEQQQKYRSTVVTAADYETEFYRNVSCNVRDNLEYFMEGRIEMRKTDTDSSTSTEVIGSTTMSSAENGAEKTTLLGAEEDGGKQQPVEPLSFQDMYGIDDVDSRFIHNVSRLHLATQLTVLKKANVLDKSVESAYKKGTASSAIDRNSTIAGRLALAEKPEDDAKDTEKTNGTDVGQETIFSGEWIRTRNYICETCFARFNNFWDMEDHRFNRHPNVRGFYYEFVTEQVPGPNWAMKRCLQGKGALGVNAETVIPASTVCTKCQKSVTPAAEFHKHILDCGGDTTWMSMMYTPTKRNKKWRPYGSRRRRNIARHRGLKRNIPTTPVKIMGATRTRQKAGDTETIQRMIANLPPKRITRRVITFDDIEMKPKNRTLNLQTSIITRKRRENQDSKLTTVTFTKPSSTQSAFQTVTSGSDDEPTNSVALPVHPASETKTAASTLSDNQVTTSETKSDSVILTPLPETTTSDTETSTIPPCVLKHKIMVLQEPRRTKLIAVRNISESEKPKRQRVTTNKTQKPTSDPEKTVTSKGPAVVIRSSGKPETRSSRGGAGVHFDEAGVEDSLLSFYANIRNLIAEEKQEASEKAEDKSKGRASGIVRISGVSDGAVATESETNAIVAGVESKAPEAARGSTVETNVPSDQPAAAPEPCKKVIIKTKYKGTKVSVPVPPPVEDKISGVKKKRVRRRRRVGAKQLWQKRSKLRSKAKKDLAQETETSTEAPMVPKIEPLSDPVECSSVMEKHSTVDTLPEVEQSLAKEPSLSVVQPKVEQEEEEQVDLEAIQCAEDVALPDTSVILAAMKETMRQTDSVITTMPTNVPSGRKRKRDENAKCKKCGNKSTKAVCDPCTELETKNQKPETESFTCKACKTVVIGKPGDDETCEKCLATPPKLEKAIPVMQPVVTPKPFPCFKCHALCMGSSDVPYCEKCLRLQETVCSLCDSRFINDTNDKICGKCILAQNAKSKKRTTESETVESTLCKCRKVLLSGTQQFCDDCRPPTAGSPDKENEPSSVFEYCKTCKTSTRNTFGKCSVCWKPYSAPATAKRSCENCGKAWNDEENSASPICRACRQSYEQKMLKSSGNGATVELTGTSRNASDEDDESAKCAKCSSIVQTDEVTLRKLCDLCCSRKQRRVSATELRHVPDATAVVEPEKKVSLYPEVKSTVPVSSAPLYPAFSGNVMSVEEQHQVRARSEEEASQSDHKTPMKNVKLICKGCYGVFDTVSSYKYHCDNCKHRNMEKKPLLGFGKRPSKDGVAPTTTEIAANAGSASFEILEGVQIKYLEMGGTQLDIMKDSQSVSPLKVYSGESENVSPSKKHDSRPTTAKPKKYSSVEAIMDSIESAIKSVCHDEPNPSEVGASITSSVEVANDPGKNAAADSLKQVETMLKRNLEKDVAPVAQKTKVKEIEFAEPSTSKKVVAAVEAKSDEGKGVTKRRMKRKLNKMMKKIEKKISTDKELRRRIYQLVKQQEDKTEEEAQSSETGKAKPKKRKSAQDEEPVLEKKPTAAPNKDEKVIVKSMKKRKQKVETEAEPVEVAKPPPAKGGKKKAAQVEENETPDPAVDKEEAAIDETKDTVKRVKKVTKRKPRKVIIRGKAKQSRRLNSVPVRVLRSRGKAPPPKKLEETVPEKEAEKNETDDAKPTTSARNKSILSEGTMHFSDEEAKPPSTKLLAESGKRKIAPEKSDAKKSKPNTTGVVKSTKSARHRIILRDENWHSSDDAGMEDEPSKMKPAAGSKVPIPKSDITVEAKPTMSKRQALLVAHGFSEDIDGELETSSVKPPAEEQKRKITPEKNDTTGEVKPIMRHRMVLLESYSDSQSSEDTDEETEASSIKAATESRKRKIVPEKSDGKKVKIDATAANAAKSTTDDRQLRRKSSDVSEVGTHHSTVSNDGASRRNSFMSTTSTEDYGVLDGEGGKGYFLDESAEQSANSSVQEDYCYSKDDQMSTYDYDGQNDSSYGDSRYDRQGEDQRSGAWYDNDWDDFVEQRSLGSILDSVNELLSRPEVSTYSSDSADSFREAVMLLEDFTRAVDDSDKQDDDLSKSEEEKTITDLDQLKDAKSSTKRSTDSDNAKIKANKNYEEVCDICDRVFKEPNVLQFHMATVHSIATSFKNMKNGGKVRSSRNYQTEVKAERQHRCNHCQKILTGREETVKHVKEHYQKFAADKAEDDSPEYHLKKLMADKLEGLLLEKALATYMSPVKEASPRTPSLPLKILNQINLAKKNQFSNWKSALAQVLTVDSEIASSSSSSSKVDSVPFNFAAATAAALRADRLRVQSNISNNDSKGEVEDGYPCPMCEKTFQYTHTRNRHLIMIHAPRKSTHSHLDESIPEPKTEWKPKRLTEKNIKPKSSGSGSEKVISSYLLQDSVELALSKKSPSTIPSSSSTSAITEQISPVDEMSTGPKPLAVPASPPVIMKKKDDNVPSWLLEPPKEKPRPQPLPVVEDVPLVTSPILSPVLASSSASTLKDPLPSGMSSRTRDLLSMLRKKIIWSRRDSKSEDPEKTGSCSTAETANEPTESASESSFLADDLLDSELELIGRKKPRRKKMSKKEMNLPASIVKYKAEQALLELCKTKFNKILS